MSFAHAQTPAQPSSATPPTTSSPTPGTPAASQAVTPAAAKILREFSPRIAAWQETIKQYEESVLSRFLSAADAQAAVQALEDLRPKLRAYIDVLKPRLEESTARLEKLGPAPKDGETEAEGLAAERAAISNEVAAFDGLTKSAEVLFVKSGQVIANLNATRRKKFLSGLLRRSENLGSFTIWRESARLAGVQLQDVGQRLARITQNLVAAWPTTLFTLGVTFALMVGLSALSRRVLRSTPSYFLKEDETLSRAERGATALRRALSVTGPVAAAFGLFYITCSALGKMPADNLLLLGHCLIYLGVGLFLASAVHYALQPLDERERLVSIDARSARAISLIAKLFVFVWVCDQLLELWDQELSSPFSLVVVRTLIVGLLYGLLTAAFITVRIRRPNAHPVTRRTNGWPRWLFGLLALSAAIILTTAILGYISLARFTGAQFVATGGLVFLVTLIHLAAEYVSTPAPVHGDDEVVQKPTVVGATIGVVAGIGLDILVLLIGLPLLLLQWGYDWAEVRGWVSSLLFGFQVGNIRISLLQLLTAIGIVIAGLVLTRIVRNMFLRRSEYMFASASGARESLATILSYVGFVLAVVAALGYLGMDVSNLALIAGALSVGIGFGLQSIANNFVSGLILLAERPIKVGDWIIVGSEQGFVQKISVRSTQIRTLDRSTLIVPNADLITNSVTNWDHGDSVGRIQVKVGVSYNSDAKAVLELLREIGGAHPSVLHQRRSPLVTMEGFGDSSLDFSLRVMVRDIRDLPIVQTDLRVAIHEAFRENGIEIPFPQRDLHLKSDERGRSTPSSEDSGNIEQN